MKHDIIFFCSVWWCWKMQNDTILGNGNLNFIDTRNNILIFLQVCWMVFLGEDGRSFRPPRLVQWNKLPLDYRKVNKDDSLLGNFNTIGIRGMVRDYTSNWITGFSSSIGVASNVHVELGFIRHGLFVVLKIIRLQSQTLLKLFTLLRESHYPYFGSNH